MLKMTEALVVEDTAVAESTRKSLRAFIQDSYAYYYFRRGKHSAALQVRHITAVCTPCGVQHVTSPTLLSPHPPHRRHARPCACTRP